MPDDAAKRAPRAREVTWLDEVDSTNVRLAELLRRDPDRAERIVVVADHQTAGRGRRGRTWEAPPGSSLLVSTVVRAPTPGLVQLTTVCAALAAADACDDVARRRPALKWPNDLVFGAAKVGGILAEAVIPRRAVVGLGLNVDWHGAELPTGATSLAAATRPGAPPVERAALLDSYLRHLDRREEALETADRRAELLDDYRRACCTLGRAVAVDLGQEQVTGTATAIADDGSLVVTTGAGARRISAGDVRHTRAP